MKELLFDYMCAIWELAACMFGVVVIGAIIKAFVDLIRRKK